MAAHDNIQRFLGFANFYRRFIAHFAWIAKPLTSLVKPTKRFKKFELPEEAQQAFHQLIQAFTSAGVLQHFDYHLPTRLETDASDFAIAGVLKQEHEECWHPVAFYSRKMSSAERNYEIHDKELLAVVACLTQWRHMLAGLPAMGFSANMTRCQGKERPTVMIGMDSEDLADVKQFAAHSWMQFVPYFHPVPG
ncbi:uncharacterized protein UDID_18673 [Ustilago sp. UG-2017a]|nr:uncharacterized protein UDID_18673 [Ustilago sp. UG-2017a]